jgi:hypothetical protein
MPNCMLAAVYLLHEDWAGSTAMPNYMLATYVLVA